MYISQLAHQLKTADVQPDDFYCDLIGLFLALSYGEDKTWVNVLEMMEAKGYVKDGREYGDRHYEPSGIYAVREFPDELRRLIIVAVRHDLTILLGALSS